MELHAPSQVNPLVSLKLQIYSLVPCPLPFDHQGIPQASSPCLLMLIFVIHSLPERETCCGFPRSGQTILHLEGSVPIKDRV